MNKIGSVIQKMGDTVLRIQNNPSKSLAAAGALALTSLAIAITGPAAAQDNGLPRNAPQEEFISFASTNGPFTGEVAVPAGKSVVLRFDQRVTDVMIGNPEVADVIALTDRSIYVLGKEFGPTSLTLYGSNRRLLGVVDLQVTYDLLNLKRRYYELLPQENIEVRSSGASIVLSGLVSGSDVSSRASQIAQQYAPDNPEAVVNMLSIGKSQQVMLKVRFAEVKRSASKAMGLTSNVLFNEGKEVGIFNSGILNPDAFATAFGAFNLGDVSISLLLDALETKGIVKTLAEPTLVAISGEKANFLAGGEFPVPANVTNNSGGGDLGFFRLGIEFKEFGVRLGFTPTVLGDTINLVVEPEVSALDPESGIQLADFVIPGLTTRRARTTVELKNGQSFAIAGLLQEDFVDELSQMPGADNFPIVGALMRSGSFKREETELAIIITPYIVEPARDGELDLPTDYLVLPLDLEIFFMGQVEANGEGGGWVPRQLYRTGDGGRQNSPVRVGGIDGEVGYILE